MYTYHYVMMVSMSPRTTEEEETLVCIAREGSWVCSNQLRVTPQRTLVETVAPPAGVPCGKNNTDL